MPMTKWSTELRDAFEFSWNEQTNDFSRLESLQKTYDNVVSPEQWPTNSKIPLPIAWATVEAATGPAMEYLFPATPSAQLFADGVSEDVIDRFQWAIHQMMNYRMRIKRPVTRSVRDCFKVGVGYGIVEPITITPPAVFTVRAGDNETQQMGVGRPVRSLRYRYLSPGKVLPFPAGTDFNGDDPTPYSFLLDYIPEAKFLKMFDEAPRDGDDIMLKGDAQAMVDESKTIGFDSTTTFEKMADTLAGRKLHQPGVNRGKKVPSMVPVLKCYAMEEGRHTWIFPGKDWVEIWDKQGTYDTARNPCVKFDAWVDSDRWYPMSQPEADERVIWESNILVNAANDLITQTLKRPLIWNNDLMDSPPDFGVRGEIGVPGKPDEVARFVDPPRFDNSTFEMMNRIDNAHNEVTGQRDFTERNFTRGGTKAFQDLLQSSTGRERLRMMLLETGGFESIAWQTMIYMQVLGGEMNLKFDRPAVRTTDGSMYRQYFSITEQEMKNTFDLMLDLEAKSRFGTGDFQTQMQRYLQKKDNPAWDQYEIQSDLEPDALKLMRQRLPKEQVQEKQRAREAAELEQTRQAPPGAGRGQAVDPASAGRERGGAPGPAVG